jgi:hypothetical protein
MAAGRGSKSMKWTTRFGANTFIDDHSFLHDGYPQLR